jgi:hypothetical protein
LWRERWREESEELAAAEKQQIKDKNYTFADFALAS